MLPFQPSKDLLEAEMVTFGFQSLEGFLRARKASLPLRMHSGGGSGHGGSKCVAPYGICPPCPPLGIPLVQLKLHDEEARRIFLSTEAQQVGTIIEKALWSRSPKKECKVQC